MMKDRILLVEDEASLAMIVAETLTDEGFDVDIASDGLDGLGMLTRESYDIVVADVMMPRLDGFEMCRRLRRIDPDIPLLFLTAKSSIDDIVDGFELGANDYLKKPFKMRELIVRIKALLRRRNPTPVAQTAPVVPIGGYKFNSVSQTLEFQGKSVELSHFESVILEELAANMNLTVGASELMMKVWQRDDIYNRNSLHGFIHKLRRLLRHDPSIAIINLRGIGYKLVVRESGGQDD